jgi:RIO kinase 1
VYHAVGKESEQLAVKVYKTSILVFKDRDRYVTGEFRFRKGYAKHNPRKMVRLWAEKEYRNLTRYPATSSFLSFSFLFVLLLFLF